MITKILTAFVPLAAIACLDASALLAAGVHVPYVPDGLSPGDKYHVVFMSEGGRTATSSDISDYNAFVTSEAERVGAITENWGIDWFAIGSTSTVNARDNAVVSGPVYMLREVNGDFPIVTALVANDAADMWDGATFVPLTVDQFGNRPSTIPFVWTGSQSNGRRYPSLGGLPDSPLGASLPRIGRPAPRDDWLDSGSNSTQIARPLYALSEVLTVVPEPTSSLLLCGSGLLTCLRRRRS